MDYLGKDRPRRELEITGFDIDPAHRADLPELMASRWFAYRTMHPVEATYLYAALYREHVREFAESYVDIVSADQARAFTPADIFMSRDMTAMWLARSAADRVGCPYPTALSFISARALERTFQRFPRPNQLYGEDVELDLADHWKEMCQYSLQYVRDDHFRASRHDPASAPPEVTAHVRFLVAQVQGRARPHHKVLGRLFREDRLSPAWVADDFAPAEIREALVHAQALSSARGSK